ncbi:glycoside hydrolase [Coprinellus micaceus]|uniref:Glycoside hydrolase n=1 Tax=Coprinellus micaceus TaxID=71717 RepID=A0A4Y7T4Y7_COPMI|nr:glycoside hydrolase [Coprinellus micaceus]
MPFKAASIQHPNDETRSPNATTTVDSANSPAFLVVTQGLKNAFEKIDRGGEAAVLDGEAVIFDGGGFNSEDDSSLSQDALVRQQLAIFRQVNEGPNADTEEIVELGFVWVLGRPRVFASDEVWGGPTTSGTSPTDLPWWKTAVVYQIYPISFFDSNGDGFGDLNGIASKLDYLKDLGVDVLWLSPIYRSPLADMGYDISDYQDIDPRYGTLKDWDNLLHGVHERGMKLIMDLVVNHSSDEHDWFTQSRSDKSNPKRDWYIWRPPKYDAAGVRHPPNNWKAVFQGSAWEYDAHTDEYYLHIYLPKQPDLNWDNPEVREAVYRMMKFWLDRGCDGFRMDVINILSKADGLPDAPISVPGDAYQHASIHFANGPRVHEHIKEMHEKVLSIGGDIVPDDLTLSEYDAFTVGETPFTHDAEELAAYVLPKNKELNMVFQFQVMDLDHAVQGQDQVPLIHKEWNLAQLKEIVTRWQTFKRDDGFWNATFTENHDHPRSVSRFGDDSDDWRVLSAKLLALFQVTQGGTQFLFQGQELGLKNFPRTWGIEEYKDVASQNYWDKVSAQRKEISGGKDVDMSDILNDFAKKARDHARVPMQWNPNPNAGFTKATPWMRVNEDYKAWNAERQAGDEESVLAFWKKVLKIRKEHPVLISGEYEEIAHEHEQIFAWIRRSNEEWTLTVLNFGKASATLQLSSDSRPWSDLKLEIGNYHSTGEVPIAGDAVELKGWECRLYISTNVN